MPLTWSGLAGATPAITHLPTGRGIRASIFGYQINGEERVGVAWVDRDDAASPRDCVANTSPVSATWYASSSDDLGESWGCFAGTEWVGRSDFEFCDVGAKRTFLAGSSAFPPCVTGSGNPVQRNDRPEVAISAPAVDEGDMAENDLRKFFYFGIDIGSKILVLRTGGSIYVNPDYETIADIAETTSPSAQAPHAHALVVTQTLDGPRLEMTYREFQAGGTTTFSQRLMEAAHNDDPNLVSPTFHTVATAGPRNQGYWGRHSAIAVFEQCDDSNATCLSYPGDSNDDEFELGWTSTQNTGHTRAEVYTQSFEWN